jgi:T5orf172 domain
MVWSTADGGWIYAAREDDTPLVKIGYTRRTPRERLYRLRREVRPSTITLVAAVQVESGALFVEQGIHTILRPQHIQGEWFYISMTQPLLESLAKRVTSLWKVFHGERPDVSTTTVRQLARVLGVSTDFLLGMDEKDSESEAAELAHV